VTRFKMRIAEVIERAYREGQRRADRVGRFPGEMAALVLIWAKLKEGRLV
jgi:transposase-like protein